MKGLFWSIAISSIVWLTGCGKSLDEIKETTPVLTPESRFVFDPANGLVPLPNDLLFSGSVDGTLNIPGENESGDYTNPQFALGALDGWSTIAPISIDVDLAKKQDGSSLTLLASSVTQPGAVRLFEATVGGALSSDPECKAKAAVSACKIGAELAYGADFISQVSGNRVVIVPIKPLKQNQSYVYITTNLVQDSEGRAVAPSTTYNLLKLDVETHPLETQEQLLLQTLVNSYEKGLASSHGVNPVNITYSGLFTTQSIPDVYETTKLLMANTSQPNPYAPLFVSTPTSTGQTAAQQLGLTVADGAAYTIASLADVYKAQIRLPIYGECSSVVCLSTEATPLINSRWRAQGDSPIGVLQALQAGTLSQENFVQQAVTNGINPTAALANPALMVGKTWRLNNGTSIDLVKHLTKFNPVPHIRSYETVDVLLTIPNANTGMNIPATGWPTVIGMHGLGAGRQMALAYAGAYAAQGVAVIAIDMPLHGSRSFAGTADINNGGSYLISATAPSFGAVIGLPNAFVNGNSLVFTNINSSLTARDNIRQAVMDHLGVRLAFTGLYQQLAQQQQAQLIDVSKITVQGLSLGGIVGTSVATYASTGIVDPASGELITPNPYAVKGVALVAPVGGLAGAFAGSATFGPTLFNAITVTNEFKALVAAANTQGHVDGTPAYTELVQSVYDAFIPSFAFAVQTAVDSADPINQSLKATQIPVALIEIVGDETNKSDQVLPNRVAGFPLSGTEPLISVLGLGCVDHVSQGSGVVRFTKGHHSSLVVPNEVDGVTDGSASAATTEMQAQVSIFARTAADGNARIQVNNTSLVQSCGG